MLMHTSQLETWSWLLLEFVGLVILFFLLLGGCRAAAGRKEDAC